MVSRDYRKLAQRVAKVALAGAFGGPLGALSEAGTQVVDSLLGERVPGSARTVEEVVRRIGSALEDLARSEHVSQEALDRALLNACDVLQRHALSTADLVGLDLDVGRATGELRRRAHDLLGTLDEEDRQLCELVLDHTMRVLLREPALLPDLQQQFQHAVLARLSGRPAAADQAARAAFRLGAQAMIAEQVWPWLREQYPPSALLRANYSVVPFFGRGESLEWLAEWCAEDTPTGVGVITGAGGMGKTRLLLQGCRLARAAGWAAGFLHSSVLEVTPDHLEALADGRAGVLVVVDYAETRRGVTAALLESALSARVRVRVVLLARSLGDWWVQLQYRPGRVGDFLDGPRVQRIDIVPVAVEVGAREATHHLAAEAFARALGVPTRPVDIPDLSSPLYERVLFVHLGALAAVLGEPAQTQKELLGFALRREQGFLDLSVRTAGLPQLAGRPIRQAAALATMAGGAHSFPEALALISQVPLLAGQPQSTLAQVALLLHDLYPAQSWLAGVQPDLLGEHLVSRTLDDDPLLLVAMHGAH